MLVVESVSVNYGAIRAVQDVSLQVSEGEIVTLLGPNGAGKSSLLMAIAGVVPLAAGRVVIGGTDVTGKSPEDIVRLGVSVTPEGRRIFVGLTVEENLLLGASTRKDKEGIRRDFEEYLDMFPILRERFNAPAETLSGGEQQQLAIARSLVSRPKLLMLDEPSLGLAPRLVEQIFDHMGRLKSHALTMLLVEQNAHQALAFADRAYVLSTGRLQYSGNAKELLESDQLMEHYVKTGATERS